MGPMQNLFRKENKKKTENKINVYSKYSRGPVLESPAKFSGPKSHFKNHEAFDVQQSFLCQHVLHLSKAYTYATFRI